MTFLYAIFQGKVTPFNALYILLMLLLLLIAVAMHKEKREKLFVLTLLLMTFLSLFYSMFAAILDYLIRFKEAFFS